MTAQRLLDGFLDTDKPCQHEEHEEHEAEEATVYQSPTGKTLYQWPDGLWRYVNPPTEPTIFTAGYGSQMSPDALAASLQAINGVLVDVRLHPWSRERECWRKDGDMGLAARFGHSYVWLPQWGNRNHKPEDRHRGIDIADWHGGLSTVRRILDDGRCPVLLCACGGFRTCHRATLSERLAAQERIQTRELIWLRPEARSLTPEGDPV